MKQRRIYLLLCGVLLGAVGPATCRPPAAEPPPLPDFQNQEDYRIGAGDVLQISVWKNQELSVEVPVRADGRISVPLLDDVQAEGLTAIELKDVITDQLSEYITNPDVTVIVAVINSKRVYVIGEVPRPGPIPMVQPLRVLEVISIAGGFNTFADKNNIRILRNSGNEVIEYRFDYEAFLRGGNPEANMYLMPGDTVVVPD